LRTFGTHRLWACQPKRFIADCRFVQLATFTDLIVADLARGSRTGLVTETSYAFGNEAIAPETYGESRRAQLSRHRRIAQTTAAVQHDAGTESYRTRATRLLCQSFQFGSLCFLQAITLIDPAVRGSARWPPKAWIVWVHL
jgi:hypothetical protein